MVRLLIVVLLGLSSCGSKIEKKQLMGRYVWNENRIDTLEIHADGTYEYWTFKPGQKIAVSGNWKFNSLLNEVEFQRENFPFLEEHTQEGGWFSKIRIINDEIHLLKSGEDAQYLRKL